MRLGYVKVKLGSLGHFGRFNEAEAHAPRIRHLVRGKLLAVSGFNEAEAHAPRIP